MDVVVVGAGPAGVFAARRAASLGAQTTLVTRDAFGGTAANDGPVPVRTLAHAARLMRDAGQLGRYGVFVSEPTLDFPRLLARVRDVVDEVRTHTLRRGDMVDFGVVVHERVGNARFADPHTIETASGLRLRADRIILCAGGTSRRLRVPGSELISTHSDAWALTSVPSSMLVIGGGATAVQVASIFNAFGTRVELFQASPRILSTEDEDVSEAVTSAFRASGIRVHESYGTIESFEATPDGVRMTFSKDGGRDIAEAEIVVVAVGWVADTAGLNLAVAGVELDQRGFVRVDPFLRTSVSHVYAAGDITGRLTLVPQAVQDGFVAATNAVTGPTTLGDQVSPVGSFTDPEYAQVGITEAAARASHDPVVAVIRFDETTRTIIDGRTLGFCKLIADRETCTILGCHVVGERAVEIVQVAAIAMAAKMRVDELARVPLSFPTYAGILVRAAYSLAQQLDLAISSQVEE
jgi:dihydrolipoamide dehydrogenase